MQSAGFIGLGAMGAPMAKRIVSAGFDLSVFDVRPENADPLVELGARRAGSPREAAEGAEALVLMVVNAEQAEDALFGGDGAAETLSPESAVVVMSTVGPEAVRRIGGRFWCRACFRENGRTGPNRRFSSNLAHLHDARSTKLGLCSDGL